MAATRRQVSGSFPPPIPEKSPKRLSLTATLDNTNASETDSIERAVAAHKKRRESFQPNLDISRDIGEDLSLDLDKEFNRVIESSKVDCQFHLKPIRESENSCTYDLRHHVYATEEFAHAPANSELPSFQFVSDLQNANVSPKKGYLMRQNTKVIVAKRNFSNETNSV